MRKVYNAFIFIVLSAGCTSEELTTREYPRVTTLETVEINESGVTVNGEVLISSVDITDHGFVWTDAGFAQLGKSPAISLGPKSGAGPFSARVDGGLEPGKEYRVRAYAKSDKFVVYGKEVKFTSLGSLAPEIKSFSPAEATWGDTISLRGTRLAGKVMFGNVEAFQVPVRTDSLIKAVVPLDYVSASGKIALLFAGNSVFTSNDLKLKAPLITDISPRVVRYGEKFTVLGKYFHPTQTTVFANGVKQELFSATDMSAGCFLKAGTRGGQVYIKIKVVETEITADQPIEFAYPTITAIAPAEATFNDIVTLDTKYLGTGLSDNDIRFDGIKVQVVEIFGDKVKVKVPVLLNKAASKVTAAFGGFTSEAVDFKLLAPVILAVSPSRVSFGATITITGKNFNPQNGNTVYMGDIGVSARSLSATSIEATVPSSLTAHEVPIDVETAGQKTSSGISLSSPWAVFQYGVYSGAVVVDGKWFSFSDRNDVYQFDPIAKQWISKGTHPMIINSYSTISGFSVDKKTYLLNSYSKEMWRYDVGTETWDRMKDVPFNTSSTAMTTAVSGIGYYLIGSELWKYNAADDAWTEISTVPGQPWVVSNFVFEGELYLICNLQMSGTPDVLWKYDKTGTWINLGSLPVSSLYNSAFQVNGKIYIAMRRDGTQLWEYVPTGNTWKQELQFGASPTLSYTLQVFTVGSKVYFMTRYPSYELDVNY